jgi:hypothetical protein
MDQIFSFNFLNFFSPLDFDSSLKDDLVIPLHVDDYNVLFLIDVFEFQFSAPIVDHSPSPDFDVVVIDFEASHEAMDKDFPFGDFNAKFQFLDVNESKLNNVNKGG